MADRDVLAPFSSQGMPDNRATNGGQCIPKDLPYDPPQGPKGIAQGNSPGIGGSNHGNNGTQGKH